MRTAVDWFLGASVLLCAIATMVAMLGGRDALVAFLHGLFSWAL